MVCILRYTKTGMASFSKQVSYLFKNHTKKEIEMPQTPGPERVEFSEFLLSGEDSVPGAPPPLQGQSWDI